MSPADFLIENASLVATSTGPAPRRGTGQGEIAALTDAVIASAGGVIVYAGPSTALADHVEVERTATRIDATGCTIVPGFVDAHTHVCFAGDRRGELRRRLAGATYGQIAAEGGGIVRTVAATRAASADELVAATRPRLDEMLACGTTTAEAKSGYGLTTESELRQLRAIRQLDREHAIDLVPTFMGAHEVPVDYRSRRQDYVALVIDDMIPRVAEERLATWCDVFCEQGVFTPAESTAVLAAGRRHGLLPRVHADEFGSSGGSFVAAEVGARSADHLLFVDEHGMDALAPADTCATLLPIAAFYLGLGRYAPARALIERGIPVALGTDINPGAGFSPSMPFAMTLACFAMKMTLEEALVAATLNAAWSVGRSDSAGSLEPGKLLDAVVIKGDLADLLRIGVPAIRMVIKRGKVVT
jgi:imidazolonepropionase